GSVVKSAASCGRGAVKGWCMAAQVFSSSSQANIGNSTTQEKFIADGSYSFSSSPSFLRRLGRALQVVSNVSATNRRKSPGLACMRSAILASRSGEKFLAMGEASAPDSSTLNQASPFAPETWHSHAVISSMSLREYLAAAPVA